MFAIFGAKHDRQDQNAADYCAYNKKSGSGSPKHCAHVSDEAEHWRDHHDEFPVACTQAREPLVTKKMKQQVARGNPQSNGKRITERGSIWTVTLQKVGDNWRITGWAWSKH